MLYIEYSRAFNALNCFVDQINQAATKTSERLRSGTVLAAKEIIRIYGISLLKSNVCRNLDVSDLPSLQTNNHQLAKLVKCSERTIQRHVHKLLRTGFITRKLFHGSRANYELWINPGILLIKSPKPVDKPDNRVDNTLEEASEKEPETAFLVPKTTNCPHTYTGNINNLIIDVENPSKDTGNTGESGQRAGNTGDRNVPPAPARDHSLNHYTELFWFTARNLLYKTVTLTQNQVNIARQLIRKLYEPVSDKGLEKVHQSYTERLSLVARYVRKDPSRRFVPLPYLYFDTNNPKGFTGTKNWLKAHRARKMEVQRELLLAKLIKKFQSNNTAEVTKRKPTLRLFRECENTLGKLGDQSLLDRFYAAVMQPNVYSQITLNL